MFGYYAMHGPRLLGIHAGGEILRDLLARILDTVMKSADGLNLPAISMVSLVHCY